MKYQNWPFAPRLGFVDSKERKEHLKNSLKNRHHQRLLIDPAKLEVIAHLKSNSNFDWISFLPPTVIGTEGS
jgi:hypothetical protein